MTNQKVFDTIYWGEAFMNIEDGLYLFPEGEKFSVYGLYLRRVIELGTASAGELLIDFLDYDFSTIFSAIRHAESLGGNEIFNAIENLDDNVVTLFIKIMTNHEWARAYDLSPESWQDEYSMSVMRILNSIISMHQNVWELADYYCERYGSAEERFDFIHALREPFTSMTVEEIISARKPGRDFFEAPSENDYSFPYTRAYRFTDVEDYAQFIFLNTMRYNSNFSKCNYCYRFFIPKTKKLTRFCDRVNLETGQTCKETAPTVYRNDGINSNKILKQYDLAVRRNYMRMCRGEDRLPSESAGKDLLPEEYFEWRDRAIKAMRLWKDKKISEGELLEIVKELD